MMVDIQLAYVTITRYSSGTLTSKISMAKKKVRVKKRSIKKRPVKKKATKENVASSSRDALIRKGTTARTISVPLSYKIVRLFSEGLYQSANKAFEELVTNSFDAGATTVNVLLPSDPTSSDAMIAIADNGAGMDVDGLQDLWRIGVSNKRQLSKTPKSRVQIGKFGIGKLSTYVLADEISYICKRRVRRKDRYYAVTMNYGELDTMAENEVVPDKPMQLKVRELRLSDAKDALAWCTRDSTFVKSRMPLFGTKSPTSWTVAILSKLKEKANEIQEGRLRWILETALPLRDDFSIWLAGIQVKSSRSIRDRIGRWIIGKDIKELSKPAPEKLKTRRDSNAGDGKVFGLFNPVVGRITGYAEAFQEVLTGGKAAETGRSNGFFVYVRNRLVNIEDEYFGIDSNKLAHGTFSRFRVVLHVDSLDDELQSAREGVREGPKRKTVQKILQGIFNFVRKKVVENDEKETSASQISEKLAATPSSLTRRPLVSVASAVFDGSFDPVYSSVPENLSAREQKEFLEQLEERESPDDFVSSVEYSMSLSPNDGIALYDTGTFHLQINGLHPFVGASASNFQSEKQNRPLQLLAMAEVLLEAQLFHAGFEATDVHEVMHNRDELLRYLGRSSGRRTALMISQDLKDARNDKDALEDELVASFESLGFDAFKIGGRKNPDGVAHAHLSADKAGPRSYSVSLEAKSKEEDGKKVSAKTVGVSTVARHRESLNCDHAVVVGPDFPTAGESASLLQELTADRENTGKSITLVKINDFAKLVRIAPLKQLTPSQLRDLFRTCSSPQESKEWIDNLSEKKIRSPRYRTILNVIWKEQKEDHTSVVTYDVLRVLLRGLDSPIKKSNEELKELCKSIMGIAPGFLNARDGSVELEFPPSRVLEAIETSTNEYPEDEIDG